MKKSFLLALAVVVSVGCAKDSAEEVCPDTVSTTENETFEVQMSPEDAVACVEDMLGTLDVKTRGMGSARRVVDVYRVKDSRVKTRASGSGGSGDSGGSGSDSIPIEHYIINFADNQGFAFVFGDNRLESPILAITDNGHLDPAVGTDNPGLITALALGEEWYVNESLRWEDAGISQQVGTGVAETVNIKYMELPDDVYLSLPHFTGTGAGTWMDNKWHIEDYGIKKTNLEWGQGDPFNANAPKLWNDVEGKYELPPIGCTATATMLLMAWFSAPISYDGYYQDDWNDLLKYKTTRIGLGPASDAAKRSIARWSEIITRPENLNMKFGLYKDGGSGADEGNIPRTLQRLGYSYGGIHTDWNTQTAINELKRGLPMVVSGFRTVIASYFVFGIPINAEFKDGHTFLLETLSEWTRRRLFSEGEIRSRLTLTNPKHKKINDLLNQGYRFYKTYTKTLAYINWGWDGSYNGYFNVGVFKKDAAVSATRSIETSEGDYKFDVDMVYGMRP